MKKPHLHVPIVDCGEPLVPIPPDLFAYEIPHPYMALGAPYGDKSPYFLRSGVLDALRMAQAALLAQGLGWRIQIFDAYRPIAVQQFMVDYTFAAVVRDRHLTPDSLTPEQRKQLLEVVYEFWAAPSLNPATPPPHSTGAAIDVTLVDEHNCPIEMGSAIDEISPRSYPNYFSEIADADLPEGMTRDRAQLYQANRQMLCQIMTQAGFRQHPREWWHFSLGDQLWAWLINQDHPAVPVMARYGAA